MKLRVANKILKSVGTGRESAYTVGQIHQAYLRQQRTKESREVDAWWHDLLGNKMTIADRAYCLPPNMALNLLMRNKVEAWDKTANQIRNQRS